MFLLMSFSRWANFENSNKSNDQNKRDHVQNHSNKLLAMPKTAFSSLFPKKKAHASICFIVWQILSRRETPYVTMISKAQDMNNNMFILPGDLNAYFNEF